MSLVSLRLLYDWHVRDGVHGAGLRRQRHWADAVSIAADQGRLVTVAAGLRRDVLAAGRVVRGVAVVVGVWGSSGALESLRL